MERSRRPGAASAGVVKLADTRDLKSLALRSVRVRAPPPAFPQPPARAPARTPAAGWTQQAMGRRLERTARWPKGARGPISIAMPGTGVAHRRSARKRIQLADDLDVHAAALTHLERLLLIAFQGAGSTNEPLQGFLEAQWAGSKREVSVR